MARKIGAEREFLPAVLEIQETPPSPLGRSILWALLLLITSAVAWASLSEVDIVAVAQGKIIPAGRVKVVQPLEIGIVRAIHAAEGQVVKEGELLIELDPEVSNADMRAVQQRIAKLEETLPLLREKAKGLRELAEQDLIPKATWLEVEQQRISVEHDLGELRQELIKSKHRGKSQKLTAPISGVVQQLAVHTLGGVVTPAQQLMIVVPRDLAMEIEAWVPNKDIGFVWPGQEAQVKVETFPFTKYGTIGGKLLDVSKDAIDDEKLGLVYAARVAMERGTMMVDGREVSLSPGMAVSVEVKTGQRRMIEYFLSPLLRHRAESIRER